MSSESALEQSEGTETLPATEEAKAPAEQVSHFHFRRDIKPTNVALSSSDLKEFIDLIVEVNERAQKIQIDGVGLSNFESPEDAKKQAQDWMPVEHRYTDSMGDSVQGLGPLDIAVKPLPNHIQSMFVSNSAFTKRVFDTLPANAVDAFIDFRRPSLAIDFITSPSNPTENSTVINVYGLNEDWVNSTAIKIKRFFEERRVLRPKIHGSGIYDTFVWLLFLPALISLYIRSNEFGKDWLATLSQFTVIILAIYAIFVSLFGARFLFQYFRWLFPPVEYFKTSMFGANLHRAVASFFALGIVGSAAYDIVKGLFETIF